MPKKKNQNPKYTYCDMWRLCVKYFFSSPNFHNLHVYSWEIAITKCAKIFSKNSCTILLSNALCFSPVFEPCVYTLSVICRE